MKCKLSRVLTISAIAGFALQARADIQLGTAGNFAVLAGSAVTNTGASVIRGGHVGISPGSSISGFPPGLVSPPHTIHAMDAVALQAQNDLTTAYNVAAGMPFMQDLTGQDLGGLMLLPGVYFFSSSAQLTGTLTLDNLGDADAEFVFQIGSSLTTASDSSVEMIGGAPHPGCGVFWQVGSSATLGTNTDFAGTILALTSVTLNNGAVISEGGALARNGAVTLDTNTIDITDCHPVPVPGSLALALIGVVMLKRRMPRGGCLSA